MSDNNKTQKISILHTSIVIDSLASTDTLYLAFKLFSLSPLFLRHVSPFGLAV